MISVNIKITFLTWALEFIIGVSVILLFTTGANVSVHLIRLMVWVLGLVIVPFIYVLNREVTKEIIALENWYEGIKSVFLSVDEAEEVVHRAENRRNQN